MNIINNMLELFIYHKNDPLYVIDTKSNFILNFCDCKNIYEITLKLYNNKYIKNVYKNINNLLTYLLDSEVFDEEITSI